MAKRGIIVANFGPSDAADEMTEDIKRTFIDDEVIQAYTSTFMQRKYSVSSVNEAILKLKESTRIIILPTLLTSGEEFEKLNGFDVEVIEPLLSYTSEQSQLLKEIMSCYDLVEDEELILIGHGSPNIHNQIYEQLQQTADSERLRMHIGVLESSDTPSFDDVVNRLQRKRATRLLIAPLLFSSSHHLNKEIAGDISDSWLTRLRGLNYQVRVETKGLGNFSKIKQLYINRLSERLFVALEEDAQAIKSQEVINFINGF